MNAFWHYAFESGNFKRIHAFNHNNSYIFYWSELFELN